MYIIRNEGSTDEVIQIVDMYIKENRDIDTIVVASTSGKTVLELIKTFDPVKFNIINVTHCYGYAKAGENQMDNDTRIGLKSKGVKVFSGAHTLSAGERCLRNRFGGVYPLEIISETLCMFSKGVKVCVEFSSMALDAGLIEYGKAIIAIAGEISGADTALYLTPEHSHNILDTRIHEIICKPY